jgi:hypothetical protein
VSEYPEITRDVLAAAGGLDYDEIERVPFDLKKSQERGTWPEGMEPPIDTSLSPLRVYKKSARVLAEELGTTPRQISKLRTGRIKVAKRV